MLPWNNPRAQAEALRWQAVGCTLPLVGEITMEMRPR
jgi:hypothetical protein